MKAVIAAGLEHDSPRVLGLQWLGSEFQMTSGLMKQFVGVCALLSISLLAGCDLPIPAPAADGQSLEVTPVARTTSASDVEVLKFGAPWCGPCRHIDEELDRLQPVLEAQGVRFQRINVDRERSLANQYNVSSIPLVVILHDGQVVDKQVGYQTAEQLQTWITSYGLPAGGAGNQPSSHAGSVNQNPFAAR